MAASAGAVTELPAPGDAEGSADAAEDAEESLMVTPSSEWKRAAPLAG